MKLGSNRAGWNPCKTKYMKNKPYENRKQKGEMKEMYKKSMLKAVVAFAVALVFILPGSAVFANIGRDINESSEFMLAGADYISQSQQTNFDPDWIHFDDGTTVNAIGLTAGGSWEGAIRITPTELVGYDGYEITAVRWHHGAASNSRGW